MTENMTNCKYLKDVFVFVGVSGDLNLFISLLPGSGSTKNL